MPIREYTCRDCATEFEELVRTGESVECPSCGRADLEPRLSTFAAPGGAAPGRGLPDSFSLPTPGSCGTCGDPAGPGACSP